MLKEYTYSFLLFIFFVFILDFIIRASAHFKSNFQKQTSLCALLILSFNNNYENIQNKKTFINRFLVIALSSIILTFINIQLIYQNLTHEKVNIYFLSIGIICSFIHSFFSLLSNDLISIYKSTYLFRLRLTISLIFLSVAVLIQLTQNTVLNIFYILICLAILSYLVSLNYSPNNHQNNFSLKTNSEYSFGLNRLYYYLFGLLEELFYISVIVSLTQIYGLTYFYEYLIMTYVLVIITIVTLNKLMFNNRIIFNKKFIESDLLVTVFFIFGLAKLLTHIV